MTQFSRRMSSVLVLIRLLPGELAEWRRTSVSLPVGVLVGVPRSGSVESVDQDRRRRTEITQRLQREIRCYIPASLEGVFRRLEGLGMTAAAGRCTSAWLAQNPRAIRWLLRRRSSLDFAEAHRRVKAPLATLAADAALTRRRAPVRIGNYWSDGLMCPDQAVRSTGHPASISLRTSRRSEHARSAGKEMLAVLR